MEGNIIELVISNDFVPGPGKPEDISKYAFYYLLIAIIVAGFLSIPAVLESKGDYIGRVYSIFLTLIIFGLASYIASLILKEQGIRINT